MAKSRDIERIERLKQIVLSMPEKPGSYQFYDQNHQIIYVGKAKKLKARVSTYFHKEVDRYKTKLLVSKIEDISYTVVNTEEDALLLENNLIKKYQPKYNILLKDGKTYPYICITKDFLPKIIKTRQINKKLGTYFGPYSHIGNMYAILELIHKIFKPRTCYHTFTAEGIEKKQYRPCLEYHLHNCLGPCIAKQSIEEYRENIMLAKEILKGNTRNLSSKIYDEMLQKSKELKFEEAAVLKEKYLLLENFVSKSEVVSHTINNVDVFTINDEMGENLLFVNYLHVKNGTIVQSFTYEYKRKLAETKEEILLQAIQEIRDKFGSTAKEIIVPFKLNWALPDTDFFIPQRGDKKQLLELSEMNAKQYRFDRLKRIEKLNPEQRQTRLMKELQQVLGLDKLPYHIECFDNSNISGTDSVAACVVFKAMKPSKKDYRKYNIKTVIGPDDYGSMKEVVHRRYSRAMEEGSKLPDLIITDGGIGQMNVVKEVIYNELGINVAVAGLAKDNRHRTNELLYGDPAQVIGLKTNSELFKVLTQMQDEVHRFAITFHRDKRSKRALHSELDEIKGIGEQTKQQLLAKLKSVKRIKEADIQALTQIIGQHRAALVWSHFHTKDSLAQ